jgi:hypothetical protein
MPIDPKKQRRGVWIWKLGKIRPDYLDALTKTKCNCVYLKVFDDLGSAGGSFLSSQCTPALIDSFKGRNIQVVGWGYHFDQRTVIDPIKQAATVKSAMDCGLAGYILDLEKEVEDDFSTHSLVRELCREIKTILPAETFLGYTSFGHPGKHPGVPWKILDLECDGAFPQIYYEKFTFGASDDAEVQACLKAHADLGLKLPILPLWGSEEDAPGSGASVESLQHYLNAFPGSSIFRVPNVGQKGQAWNLNYSGSGDVVFNGKPDPKDFILPRFALTLQRGSSGRRVRTLQDALRVRGFNPGAVDGKFGPNTTTAVKRFQLNVGLAPDGIAGPLTWVSLGGEFNAKITVSQVPPMPTETAERIAAIAEAEAAQNLEWTSGASKAEKYLKPLRKRMQELGHIGPGAVWYNWCAAFVTYCTRAAGLIVPDQPSGFWATMALVEAWKYWAKQNGTWHNPKTMNPNRGDIVCFEWNDGDAQLDHIGIVRSYSGGSTLETSEGNRGNRTVNGTRNLSAVAGIIRLSL